VALLVLIVALGPLATGTLTAVALLVLIVALGPLATGTLTAVALLVLIVALGPLATGTLTAVALLVLIVALVTFTVLLIVTVSAPDLGAGPGVLVDVTDLAVLGAGRANGNSFGSGATDGFGDGGRGLVLLGASDANVETQGDRQRNGLTAEPGKGIEDTTAELKLIARALGVALLVGETSDLTSVNAVTTVTVTV
jgi:hypothetical protein